MLLEKTIITLIILFTTHVVGGLVAFGSTLLALPLLLCAGWELREAVAMLLIIGSVQALNMAWLTWRDADRSALGRICLLAGAGIPIGFLFADLLPDTFLGIGLGLVLAVAGLSRLIEQHRRKPWQIPPWALKGLLVMGGLIHGAFGSGGATLTVYARYALPQKDVFRGTLSVMWVILNLVVITGLVVRGEVPSNIAVMAVPGVPTILLATWLGHRLAVNTPQDRFIDIVSIFLFCGGILTIAQRL